MSFSYKDVEVLGMAVDTETDPKLPAWAPYKRVLFDMDGLVHRVTCIRELGPITHDEVMYGLEPWTGCGIPLVALAKEGIDDPVRVGFRGEEAPLTCIACASGAIGFGDRYRQTQKQLMFGALYGHKASAQTVLGRMSGKSNYAQAIAQYQNMVRTYVQNYVPQDVSNAMALGAAIHRALERKPRYGASFMRQLARAVLA